MQQRIGWVRALVIDAVDPARLAAFWSGVVGTEIVEEQDDWIQLMPDPGGVYLAFQPVADPAAAGQTRVRLDLEVPDMDEARAQIEAAGGSFVAEIHEADGNHHYRMADPEGNEFTVLLPLPPELAEQAYAGR